MIVYKVIYHTIYNQTTSKLEQLDQLLLIVRGKGGVGKIQVIKAIHQAYDLVDKVNQIFITALTETGTDNINGSILHITLEIDTWKTKK